MNEKVTAGSKFKALVRKLTGQDDEDQPVVRKVYSKKTLKKLTSKGR
jgi:hypothetical protein